MQASTTSIVWSGWAVVVLTAAWSMAADRGDDPPVDGLDVFSATAKEIEHGGPTHLAGVVTFAVKGPMRKQTITVVAAAPEAASAQS